MRWIRPRSTSSHSRAGMMRGTRSNGKNPLRSLVVVVDRKGDALREKSGGGQVALALKIRRAHFLEGREQLAVMRTHHAWRGKHLVEKIADLVFGKKVGHWNIHFVSAPEPRNEKWIGGDRARRCLCAGGAAFWRTLATHVCAPKIAQRSNFSCRFRVTARIERAAPRCRLRGWLAGFLFARAEFFPADQRPRP